MIKNYLIINVLAGLGIYFIGLFIGIFHGKKKFANSLFEGATGTLYVDSLDENGRPQLGKMSIYYNEALQELDEQIYNNSEEFQKILIEEWGDKDDK